MEDKVASIGTDADNEKFAVDLDHALAVAGENMQNLNIFDHSVQLFWTLVRHYWDYIILKIVVVQKNIVKRK